ncbi:MAG: hypothetical protein FGM58_04205 [Acidimicrobiia bacterium]|nr:hypothetical protein [Acidimicrobiia bacterium]
MTSPVAGAPTTDPESSVDQAPPERGASVAGPWRWVPLAIAVAFYVAFAVVVLTRPERMIEPDPYAYRASIVALGDGDLTLSQEQYDALSERLQQTELGGGIAQWHQRDDGQWVSEKNPGYPFLVVAFDQADAIRLGPLFYGALAAVGLWFGGRRWAGRRRPQQRLEWGGTFAIGAYFSCALAMVMAWRSTMPTFTDASLVACGLGLLVWSALALERSRRVRLLVGAAAFGALGLAFFVRYTNIVVLLVAGGAALVVCLRRRWGLGPMTLVWWGLAAIGPVLAALVYNTVVFDGPFSTGYQSSSVQFTVSAIGDNLSVMPGRLVQAMPIWLLGTVAVVVLLVVLARAAWATGREATACDATALDTTTVAVSAPGVTPSRPGRLEAIAWTGGLLLGTWVALWGLYAAYQWTTTMNGGPSGSVYPTVRFYLPALGAIALLVAWLLARAPAAVGLVVLVAVFVLGGREFVDMTNSRWAQMSFGNGPGGFGLPGDRPDAMPPGDRGQGDRPAPGEPPTGAPGAGPGQGERPSGGPGRTPGGMPGGAPRPG